MRTHSITIDSLTDASAPRLDTFLSNYEEEVRVTRQDEREKKLEVSTRFLQILLFLLEEDLLEFNLTIHVPR